MSGPAPQLVLGPVLRWVDPRRATVWLQTDRPCTVTITAGSGHGGDTTFTAYGRHFAIVVVHGLSPGTATEYQVRLDGSPVWPEPGSPYPPSRIRTPGPDQPVRLVFGSCREASPYTTGNIYPPDALDTYALQVARGALPYPNYLILLGDQVYADETSPRTRRFLRRRRRHRDGPATEVTDFTEYTELYLESWTDPEYRWLLATVPSMMIFDDHEVIDDWNTSEAWRRKISRQPWWRDRIIGALGSYWVYQHLGNLSPEELATEPTLKAVRAAQDGEQVLTEFALAADAEADGRPGPRWSFRVDIGRTRVVVLDTRCSRVLTEQRRDMLPEAEWQWFIGQLSGDYDHLVVSSSLPWLLPPAIHEAEGWNEKLCRSPIRTVAKVSEWLRQAADLEHWAAFRHSFDRLGDLLGAVAAGRYTERPPATVTVLSGDVHHTYLARIVAGTAPDQHPRTAIHQVTCSPIHNQAPHAMKLGFHIGWSRTAAVVARSLAWLSGRDRTPLRWRKLAGPYFQNALGSLLHTGRSAEVSLHGVERLADGTPGLTTLAVHPLTEPVTERSGELGASASRR